MSQDAVTANLPSRDFVATSAFYKALGFKGEFRDEHWMILRRGKLVIEFFPHPGLDPKESWFSACVRVRKVDALYDAWCKAGLSHEGIPRMSDVEDQAWGMRGFTLIDLDGSLLRVCEPID
jgi:hypothetical protein